MQEYRDAVMQKRRGRRHGSSAALVCIGVFLHFCSPAFQQTPFAEVIDRVLAVVAGDVIMMSDVRAARDLGFVDPGTAADPTQAVLLQLIDRALILDEVVRYAPPEAPQEAVDAVLATVRGRFASAQALDGALARDGLDQQQLQEIVRQNLRIQSYIAQRFAAESPERTAAIVAEWVTGLRRRVEVIDLYTPEP